MSVEAIKKAAKSSKVLLYLIFATAITIARWRGWADQEWWQQAIENGYYALMGTYSVVEAARHIATAIASGKVSVADALADPKAALAAAAAADADDAPEPTKEELAAARAKRIRARAKAAEAAVDAEDADEDSAEG